MNFIHATSDILTDSHLGQIKHAFLMLLLSDPVGMVTELAKTIAKTPAIWAKANTTIWRNAQNKAVEVGSKPKALAGWHGKADWWV